MKRTLTALSTAIALGISITASAADRTVVLLQGLTGVLGFLGIGLPPPDPDWGGMVKDTYSMISVWPHMALFPCAAISSLVVGFNLLAVGLREIGQHD